jgi:hypothetical protein
VWATALGYPLAWRKADGGRAIFWIGAAITAHPTNVEISFPHDACEELATETSTAFNETIITTRELRSLAGSLNFVAGIVHPLRSFLAPLLAALSSRKPNEWSLSHRARHRDRLPKGLIEVQQCKHALGWIMAFLKKQRGAISRVANYARRSTPRPPTPTNQIQVASPQGHHRISLTTPCLRRNDATHSHTRSSASTFQSYPLTSVRASRCSIISRSTMQPTRPPQWMPQESDAGPLPSPESQTRCPTSTQQASPQVRKSCRAITSASPAKPRSSSNGVNKQGSINVPDAVPVETFPAARQEPPAPVEILAAPDPPDQLIAPAARQEPPGPVETPPADRQEPPAPVETLPADRSLQLLSRYSPHQTYQIS